MIINSLIQNAKKLISSPLLLSGISGGVGALLMMLMVHPMGNPPTLASVDLHRLIAEFIKSRSGAHLSPEEMKQHLQQFSQQLQQTLETVARQKGVVLLPVEAVIAGCPDVTATIEAALISPKPRGITE